MWLCSDEVEEKPRLHTLHLNGLLELEVWMKQKVTNQTQKKAITNQKQFQRSKLEESNETVKKKKKEHQMNINIKYIFHDNRIRSGYLCVFRWIFRWSERENAASHSWQLYFLSPVSISRFMRDHFFRKKTLYCRPQNIDSQNTTLLTQVWFWCFPSCTSWIMKKFTFIKLLWICYPLGLNMPMYT